MGTPWWSARGGTAGQTDETPARGLGPSCSRHAGVGRLMIQSCRAAPSQPSMAARATQPSHNLPRIPPTCTPWMCGNCLCRTAMMVPSSHLAHRERGGEWSSGGQGGQWSSGGQGGVKPPWGSSAAPPGCKGTTVSSVQGPRGLAPPENHPQTGAAALWRSWAVTSGSAGRRFPHRYLSHPLIALPILPL